MSNQPYLLGIDQGSSGSRALILDREGQDGRPAASLHRVGRGKVVYLDAWADDVLADTLLA